MLKELLDLRDDLMALQSARLSLSPALNFARPPRSANGEGGSLSIARDTFG